MLLSPEGPLNWLLEVGPGIVGMAVLAICFRRLPMTRFAYVAVFLHILVLVYGGYYTYAKAPLDGPETGLLSTDDDGKGTVLSFAYARATPFAGAHRGQSVLARLTVASSGYDTVAYEYRYRDPKVHSTAKFLVGFDHVSRQSPLVLDTVDFLNDDRYAAVILGSTLQDLLVPDLERFEEHTYEEAFYQGVPWKRPLSHESGYRNPLSPRNGGLGVHGSSGLRQRILSLADADHEHILSFTGPGPRACTDPHRREHL